MRISLRTPPELARTLAAGVERGNAVEFVLAETVGLLQARFACAWMQDGDQLCCVAKIQPREFRLRRLVLPLSSVAGLALHAPDDPRKRVVNLVDATAHPAWRDASFARGTGLGAYLATPLSVDAGSHGVLEVMRQRGRQFSKRDEPILVGMARLVESVLWGLGRRVALGGAQAPIEALTRREREVLTLLAQGRSNAEIAGLLGVTLGTVQLHVQHLLSKLNVTSRTQAALRAVELGLGQ